MNKNLHTKKNFALCKQMGLETGITSAHFW